MKNLMCYACNKTSHKVALHFWGVCSLLVLFYCSYGLGGGSFSGWESGMLFMMSGQSDTDVMHELEKRLGMPAHLKNPASPSAKHGGSDYFPETQEAAAAWAYVQALPSNQLAHNGEGKGKQKGGGQQGSSQEQSSNQQTQSSSGSSATATVSVSSTPSSVVARANLGSADDPSPYMLKMIYPGTMRPLVNTPITLPGDMRARKVKVSWGDQNYSAFLLSPRGSVAHVKRADQYIIWFHGNTEFSQEVLRFLAFRLSEYGIHTQVLIPEYPGFNGEPGLPGKEAMMTMMAAWHHWFQSQSIGADQVIAAGRSIGTAMAIYWGAQYQPAGVILDAPFLNIMQIIRNLYFRPLAWLLSWPYTDYLDISESLTLMNAPTLIMMRRKDEIISSEINYGVYKILEEQGKLPQYCVFNDSSHNYMPDNDDRLYFSIIKAFIE